MDNGESSYRRFLAGDDSGMVELVRDFKDGLMLYLSSYTGDISTAEDCVQDTFIKLAVKKPHFSGFFLDSVEITGLEPATFRLRT